MGSIGVCISPKREIELPMTRTSMIAGLAAPLLPSKHPTPSNVGTPNWVRTAAPLVLPPMICRLRIPTATYSLFPAPSVIGYTTAPQSCPAFTVARTFVGWELHTAGPYICRSEERRVGNG